MNECMKDPRKIPQDWPQRMVERLFEHIHCDEVHRVSNWRTQTFHAIDWVKADFAVCVSGSPNGRLRHFKGILKIVEYSLEVLAHYDTFTS